MRSENNDPDCIRRFRGCTQRFSTLTVKDPKGERKSHRNRQVREIQGYPSGHESGFPAGKRFGYLSDFNVSEN